MKHETLRQHIEGAYETTFWGQPCTCDPKLIEAVIGDGRRLIYYTPLATRPNYYIVRVGSDWDDDVYMDRLEEVYEAIEADFGNADDSQYDPETGHSLEALDWLDTEVSAIDTWYRGSPSYEHGAGWFKDEVLRLIEGRRVGLSKQAEQRTK